MANRSFVERGNDIFDGELGNFLMAPWMSKPNFKGNFRVFGLSKWHVTRKQMAIENHENSELKFVVKQY